MTPQLLFNLALLVVVGGLLVWFPDRLTLVPLILNKVQPPTSAADVGPAETAGPHQPKAVTMAKPRAVAVAVGKPMAAPAGMAPADWW